MIYEGHQKITGLAFKSVAKNPVLFVASESEIICITLLPKDKEQKVSQFLFYIIGCVYYLYFLKV